MTSGEAFAKYHAEHVKHGGASWEFHARAQTFCATAASRIATLEQHISDLEKSLENTRNERDVAVADNAELLLTLQSVVDSIDAHAAPLAGVGVTISFPPLVRFALAQHHPGVALLEEHRKALVRARNEGLEMAAIGVGHTPPCETGVVCASCAIARGIRAMKEPEPT